MLGGKWKFEQVVVSNAAAPYITEMVPVKELPIA
jgi:hypothetical protein